MTDVMHEQPNASTSGAAVDARLSIRNVGKSYRTGSTFKHVIADLSFDVAPGEFVCVVGPSGVGKTTLLKCLSGLVPLSSGAALLDGRPIDGPPKEMALVFQDYTRSLMPWLTVQKNVYLPLRGSDVTRSERHSRVNGALAEVGLSDAASRYPWQLSGGMQQRVAIARAIAYQPEIMLMDEPFASLDAQTRFELEDLLLRVRRDLGMTMLFVTHDIDEAVYLGDRVIVLGESPCRVVTTVDIDLPAQREQISTRALPEFAAHRTDILRLIRH